MERHRRTPEEIAALKAEREARLQARLEKRAARELLLKERAERKARREQLKSMSEPEKAQARYQIRLEKARKAAGKEQIHPINKVAPYEGQITIGEWYTIRFAGHLVYGKCISHKTPQDEAEDGRKIAYEIFSFESKEKNGDSFWVYPARREDILSLGPINLDNLGYQNSLRFDGIKYY